jgi:hypothetical protein
MERDNVRVVRRFAACTQGNHGDCGMERQFKNGVLAVCGCKCHAEVAGVIAELEKQLAQEPEQETLL